jgi:hypothetical protein
MAIKFKTELLQAKKTATGIQVPDEIVEKLGAGKKPPVCITINGYTYRSTIAVMGGVYMVGVSAEHRAGANVKGGDMIEVTIELDTKPREVELPESFINALNKNAAAKKKFEALSYSKQLTLVLPVKNAKTEETAQRNILKAINALTDN